MPSNKTIDLMPGEKMILYANPHWWYFWKEVAASFGLLGLLLLMVVFGDGVINDTIKFVAGIVFVVIILATIYAFIGWKTTRFAITDAGTASGIGVPSVSIGPSPTSWTSQSKRTPVASSTTSVGGAAMSWRTNCAIPSPVLGKACAAPSCARVHSA